jgi:3-phosphoshikimate 1-carboxyvinyltransferase
MEEGVCMNNLVLRPSKLQGVVRVPPSKSLAHRAIICAALGEGTSIVNNVDYSDDIIATITAMEVLGAGIVKEENSLIITGIYNEKAIRKTVRDINCNESGSTLRFLIPLTLIFDGLTKFIGSGNLGKRPLDIYYNIFKEQGIKYYTAKDNLNLIIKGQLQPGEFKIPGNVSSQFITGLLFTLPLLNGDSKIIITTEMESRGYVDLTLSCLRDFGIEIENKDYMEFIIKGNQRYNSINYTVEGDYSQAAFFLVANMLGSSVGISDLKLDSLQGDKEIIPILERMGGKFYLEDNILRTTTPEKINGTIVDGSQCPDIIPILTLLASLSEGKTEIINAGRLRLKECDRLKAITTELNKLGANIEEKEDSLTVYGVKELKANKELWSWRDHRIAMTLAIASTGCDKDIEIKDYDCVSKSYPNFYEDFKRLGGKLHEWSMGE